MHYGLFDAISDAFNALLEWEQTRCFEPPQDRSNDPANQEDFKRLLERNPRFSDPVYRRNVQRLIERNRKVEDDKE